MGGSLLPERGTYQVVRQAQSAERTAAQLAEEARARMTSRLEGPAAMAGVVKDEAEIRTKAKGASFSPDGCKVTSGETIVELWDSTGSSQAKNKDRGTAPAPNTPPPAQADANEGVVKELAADDKPIMTDGSAHVPTGAGLPPGGMGGMGMMGMGGGMMGGMVGGGVGQPGSYGLGTNFYSGYTYTVSPTATAASTGAGSSAGKGGNKPDYFSPSLLLREQTTGKELRDRQGPQKEENKPGKDRLADEEGDKDRTRTPPGKSSDQKTPPSDEPASPRKIVIRSGEVEFEIQSFDSSVAAITLMVHKIRGGFVATVNSEKLANGKVRGSVVVRVPPEHLDELILQLRKELGKDGELKMQRIGSQDITKQYTDLESRLRAARAMEERLLQIIKSGKGEIKDLLAAEKELGTWRTRIEEIEGELRYYRNLVSLSTLTITLYEKEIRAPFAIIETERVQMSLEVEEVDEALRAAQKAVLDAKGRITRSELKQHAKGQYSAILSFEVAPQEAGPTRDRLKQLGTVAQLEVNRVEETEGGTGKPRDGKVKRSDSQFTVSMYNLTNVAPRETIHISLAAVDAETTFKTLLGHIEKASGRVVSSTLTTPKADQTQGTIQFEVKTAAADALLNQIKNAGEVMHLQVSENPDTQNTTRQKRGFNVQVWALGAVQPRQTDVLKVAAKDVVGGYRAIQDAARKARGRILNASLNEQNPQNITAVVDFEFRRTEESAITAALASVGEVYTRSSTRAQDSETVIDSKVRWQLTLVNPASIPARETHTLALEVNDVDQTTANFSALVSERQGRTVESQVSRQQNGQITGRLIYDVPLTRAPELIDRMKAAGTVRVQQTSRRADVPDSPLALARLDVTLSNKSLLLVPAEDTFWQRIRDGLSTSLKGLAISLMLVIIGVCFVLPWALILYGVYRLIMRLRRSSAPVTAAPAAPAAG
jgi:hypothetical protein